MEVWKDIPGYESFYQVSDLGRVKSLTRKVYRGAGFYLCQERILKPALVKGYPAVALAKDGKSRTMRVHILVMLAFVGPCPEGQEVLHRHGDRADARLTELRYGTRRENMADAVVHGTVVGVNNGNAKLTTAQVLEIWDSYDRFERKLAGIHKVSLGTIRNLRMGRTYKGIAE